MPHTFAARGPAALPPPGALSPCVVHRDFVIVTVKVFSKHFEIELSPLLYTQLNSHISVRGDMEETAKGRKLQLWQGGQTDLSIR